MPRARAELQPLLRPSEAASILGVCEKTLQKCRARGLKWVQVTDSTVRYQRVHLDEYRRGKRGPVVRFEDVVTPLRAKSTAKRKTIPPLVRQAVYERDGHKCTYCGTEEPPFQIDHIFPVSRGGGNDHENLTVACAQCNSSKRDMTIFEWHQKMRGPE